MKKLLIVIAIILFSSNAIAMTATLGNVQVQSGELVLSFTLTNGAYQHTAEVRLTGSELASITTWAQVWSVVKPRLDDQAAKFQSMDTKADLLKTKIGVEITL